MRAMEEINDIREKLRKDPNNPYALRAVGKYYLRAGQYKLAKNHYNQAVSLFPRLWPEVMLDYEQQIEREPKKVGPRMSLAGFDVFQGDVEAAILELEEILEVSPKNVEAYNILGKIFVLQGRVDEVIALLERSVQHGIKDVALTEILAGAYLEKGRINEAIRFYNEILHYKPGDKQTLRILGELYNRVEEYNQAALSYQAMFSDDPEVSREVVQRLEALLQKQEGNVFIREILADIYMRSLKPEAAVAKLLEIIHLDHQKLNDVVVKLKAILKNYPGHPPACLALAEALRRQGNFSEAIEHYHDLVKNQPDYIADAMRGYQEVLEFCPEQVLGRTYLAEAFLYKNQVKEALEQFELMLRVDVSSAEAVVRRCREIIKSQPQLLLARLVLGRAYLALGDIQRAAVEAEGIVAIDKKFTAAYLLLGEAYFKLKLCRKAVKVVGQALIMEPYNIRIQEKYREIKERELELETEKAKSRIVEDPWRIALHLDLAKLYIQKDMQEEAIRELQTAIKDQARAPFAFNLLGCLYRGDGRFDLAAAQYNRALELAPAELADFKKTARFNLGTTFEACGQVSKAIKIYESILQEDIDFGDVGRRVKYLKATSLKSMQAKSLLMVFLKPGAKEIVAVWGREGKTGKGGRREEMSLSFGQTHNAAGFEYFMKGMYKAAMEEFQLAVQLDVKFANALNNLGVALLKEGKLYEARAKFESAIEIDQASLVYRSNLGLAYFLLGQLDQAAYEIEKAYTIDPENSAVRLNLGDICYLKKDIKRAMDLYQRTGSFDVLTEIAEQRLRFKIPQLKTE
ncbi:MAG: tetratricopeptide repeat protein [Candidatus Margulisbacteria bacterium]|nr:tetratricopeptide repeat protein [Candidatus Margulisiibacteriota bacterium]